MNIQLKRFADGLDLGSYDGRGVKLDFDTFSLGNWVYSGVSIKIMNIGSFEIEGMGKQQTGWV